MGLSRNGLENRPVFTNHVSSQGKSKTSEGYVLDLATLKRYYSQVDAEVYFGNDYIEEVVALAASIQQQTYNHFGYNSWTVDESIRGNRIIQGQFAINFTSPGYLFRILDSMKADPVYTDKYDTVPPPAKPAAPPDPAPKPDPAVPADPKAPGTTPVPTAPAEPAKTIQTVTQTGAISRYEAGPLWNKTFDIDILYGQKTSQSKPVHIILVGVVITGSSIQTSATTGQPIIDSYSFYAKDIRTID